VEVRSLHKDFPVLQTDVALGLEFCFILPLENDSKRRCEGPSPDQQFSMPFRKPLVIIYLVDGARPDVMLELLESGDLPNIRKEIFAPGTFRAATSCFPSTTGPAYLPFLMGCFPGTANLPGMRWLDKAEFHRKRWGRNSFRSYMGYEAPWLNDDLSKDHPSLHEILPRSFNVYSMITRGLPKHRDLTRAVKLPLYSRAHFTHQWRPVDHAAHKYLLRGLEEEPEFIFVVFPGVDAYSHLTHPRHEEVLTAYRFVDFSVGQVVEKLKSSGRWDDTLLLLTSDHGLSATHRHFDLAMFLQNRGMKTLFYPLVWKKNPAASVMISGNAMGHVYCLNGKSGVALQGDELPHALGSVWEELLQREEVDFVAWRGDGHSYEIVSARGRATIIRHALGLTYHPRTGDPFGLGELASPMNLQEALAETFHSDYPDALEQIEQLFASGRTGDLVVSSKIGCDLREAYEWPEHHSSHGSLHREHMMVPLLYNQTGWDERPARTTDVFNTVLKWSGKPTLENTDGQPLC